jgi:hypothetical protein
LPSWNRPRKGLVARGALVTCSTVAALVSVASCGGSSGPSTMAQFVSEANAICTSSSASSAAVPQPSVSSSMVNPDAKDLPAIATYLSQQRSILEATVSKLKALGTPPQKQDAWNQGLQAIDASVTDARAAQSAAQAGNSTTYVQALQRIVQDGGAIDTAFGQIGASACTSSATPAPSSTGSSTPSPAR